MAMLHNTEKQNYETSKHERTGMTEKKRTIYGNIPRECVILIHGYANHPVSMSDLARSLHQRGYAVVNWCYASMAQSITASAQQLSEVYAFNAPFYEKVHVVTHSMGGLVLRRFLKLSAPDTLDRLGNIVMLAPPNNGVSIARMISNSPLRPLLTTEAVRRFFGPAAWELQDAAHIHEICAIPETNVMVIAGTLPFHPWSLLSFVGVRLLQTPHDGTLTLEETRLPTAKRMVSVPAAHDMILSHPRTVAETLRFLGCEASDRETAEGGPRVRHRKSLLNVLGIIAREWPLLHTLPALPMLPIPRPEHPLLWYDVASVRGWRLQRHLFAGCYRLLDPDNVGRVWGGKQAMLQTFRERVGAGGYGGQTESCEARTTATR
jgi:pimeloyl-ACP methyl ester carboxylesterase